MAFLRQLLATHGNGFGYLSRFDVAAFATRCHRLQPLGSINAPSAGDRLGARAPTPCANRCSGEILSSSSVR